MKSFADQFAPEKIRTLSVTMKQLSPPLKMDFDFSVSEAALVISCVVSQDTVQLRKSRTFSNGDILRCPRRRYFGTEAADLIGELERRFVEFCQLSKRVKIVLLGKLQKSARFSGEEFLRICGQAWPSHENIENIQRCVNAYPLPEPGLPGGGKSLDAQGQTRKPGSHRDNRGHN
jgi:hypothetical protein